ncbi:MAG: flagellar hook-basal body complex protein [Planctomycetales bacterium]|nr:flagellar hook-basal body complex protein [Planctomycetales bacterium]
MSRSLNAGVSGLIAHQRMLDVVGNNLANANTTAFKSSRILFSDLLYTTFRQSSSPVSGFIGGVNPSQLGSGVKPNLVDRLDAQGDVLPTGSMFDFALNGSGFFVLGKDNRTVYSRAGAFALDSDGRLIDPSTGYQVQRTGTVGDPDGVNPSFQTAGDYGIYIPIGSTIPGTATDSISMMGNLTSNATGPVAEVVSTSSPFLAGGVPADGTTLLNDLDSNVTPYVDGDVISLSGTDVDGAPLDSEFIVSTTSTVGDLITALNAMYSGATAEINSLGNIVLTANETGPAGLTLSMADLGDPANVGMTDFGNHEFAVATEGQAPTEVSTALEVYDILGGAHSLNVTMTKVDSLEWDMEITMDPNEGTVLDGEVRRITFNPDGSFNSIRGTDLGDGNITVQFADVSLQQTIDLEFGTTNSFDGLTQMAANSNLLPSQNGYASGSIYAIEVSQDGLITGVATNGRRVPIAQMAIATFRNTKGLEAVGDNYYEQSAASGEPDVGMGGAAGRGIVAGGQLEASNVDIAHEFTQLIIAQRGFSANARTITVSVEMLDELVNVIR